jgi:hypothetical protein
MAAPPCERADRVPAASQTLPEPQRRSGVSAGQPFEITVTAHQVTIVVDAHLYRVSDEVSDVTRLEKVSQVSSH